MLASRLQASLEGTETYDSLRHVPQPKGASRGGAEAYAIDHRPICLRNDMLSSALGRYLFSGDFSRQPTFATGY